MARGRKIKRSLLLMTVLALGPGSPLHLAAEDTHLDRQAIDAEKEQEDKPRANAPVAEINGYLDKLFHGGVKAGVRQSDRSAEELKGSLDKLQGALDKELHRQKISSVKRSPAEVAERQRLIERLQAYIKRLGDEIFDEVLKTSQKLNELSQENDPPPGPKPSSPSPVSMTSHGASPPPVKYPRKAPANNNPAGGGTRRR